MCGLAGYLGDVTEAAASIARKMGKTLAHRGPDDEGAWIDQEAGVVLFHRRLSILELSEAGHQPMASRGGRFVGAFNGEIYNHLEIRAALGSDAWRGHSDTETLLTAFDDWGIEETLRRVVGMFSIAIWDRQSRTLTLARDRFGEKPMYYGWAGKSLVFGSQLGALRAHPEWKGVIDRDALALMLRYNYVPTPYSIYRGVWKLPPGSMLSISARDVQTHEISSPRQYWSLECQAKLASQTPYLGSDLEALEDLERHLCEAVRLQCVADVPLGAFLSGGVDSSTVVALMQTQSTRPVRTFTIGFDEPGYDEARHAAAVARHLGTEHSELYVTAAEARDVIPKLSSIYDEPFSDSSQIPTFLVSTLARQRVKVSLSGDAGDELFGGYNRYFLGRTLHRRLTVIPSRVRKIIGAAIHALPPAVLDAGLRPLGMLMPSLQMAHPSEKAYKAADTLALDDDFAVYRDLVSQWGDREAPVIGAQIPSILLDELVRRADGTVSIEQWMMTADIATYLTDDILVKVDRAAMAVSLETRVPFLDHRLVEFALRLPLRMKIRNGQGKWLLRQLLYKHVPRELIERPKTGFEVPIHSWLRGPLRDWAESLLDESRIRREGFLDPVPIRHRWQEHLSGRRNRQQSLWAVLMFQQWLDVTGPAP